MATQPQSIIAGFPLVWRQFGPPDRCFGMWTLEDPDAPLDQLTDEEFQRTDERMPYFGHIWPSAEALVEHLLSSRPLEGKTVLDLGCGLGPCGLAAARQGGAVTFLDWEPRALEILAASIAEQPTIVSQARMVAADWREVPPDLGKFDLILAADVLYEARNGPPVAKLIASHLAPDGEAWVADPGRLHAIHFRDQASTAGLAVSQTCVLPGPDDRAIQLLVLHIHE